MFVSPTFILYDQAFRRLPFWSFRKKFFFPLLRTFVPEVLLLL
ncbi:unnamed protein product [Amoebophrya sp. A25]|nr:unnamed protein product [Amoebophrya sp. A25]|eukprot:GSA25T00012254001.1